MSDECRQKAPGWDLGRKRVMFEPRGAEVHRCGMGTTGEREGQSGLGLLVDDPDSMNGGLHFLYWP